MIEKKIYDAIVAEVEKMGILVMNNDEVKKVKYVNVGNKRFRVTFNWSSSNFEGVVKVEKKYGSIYNTLFVWNSSETEKDFPDYVYEEVMGRIKKEAYARFDFYVELVEDKTREECAEMVCREIAEMTGFSVEEIKYNTALVENSTEVYKDKDLEVVDITRVEDLEVGAPHQCHFNSAMYAIENDCNFVCGWYYSSGKYPIPHCVNEKDGKYFDTTLNENGKFKVYHTYTAEEISDIYDEVGVAFVPFEMVYSESQGEYYVYDGNERVTEDKFNDFMDHINKMRWSA